MNRADQAMIAELLAEALSEMGAEWDQFKAEITYPDRTAQPALLTLAKCVFRQAYIAALDRMALACDLPSLNDPVEMEPETNETRH